MSSLNTVRWLVEFDVIPSPRVYKASLKLGQLTTMSLIVVFVLLHFAFGFVEIALLLSIWSWCHRDTHLPAPSARSLVMKC